MKRLAWDSDCWTASTPGCRSGAAAEAPCSVAPGRRRCRCTAREHARLLLLLLRLLLIRHDPHQRSRIKHAVLCLLIHALELTRLRRTTSLILLLLLLLHHELVESAWRKGSRIELADCLHGLHGLHRILLEHRHGLLRVHAKRSRIEAVAELLLLRLLLLLLLLLLRLLLLLFVAAAVADPDLPSDRSC